MKGDSTVKRAPLDAMLWCLTGDTPRFFRGYRQDFERSRNLDGTVPTKEGHIWVFRPAEGFGPPGKYGTVRAACGDRMLVYDDQRRLVYREGPPCGDCVAYIADREAAGITLCAREAA